MEIFMPESEFHGLAFEKDSKLEAQRGQFREILTAGREDKELPEAVFILAGGIKPTIGAKAAGREYESLSYGDEDPKFPGLVTAGKDRMIAAATVGKVFPEIRFVTTSQIEEDKPSYASVMAEELSERGIARADIVLEEESVSTFTELVEMVKLAVKNHWTRIGILTSEFHIPRTREMLDHLETIISYDDPEFLTAYQEFRKMKPVVSFIAADQILVNTSGHYQYLLDKVKETEGYKRRLAAEEQGIEDIRAGRYKVFKKRS